MHLSLILLQGPPCKPALRVLSERYLRRIIQQGEHDSVVDACAALDLVKLKIARGPAYGTYLQGEQGDKLMDVLHRHNKRCTLVDRTDMLNRHVTGTHLDILMTHLQDLMPCSSCFQCHVGQLSLQCACAIFCSALKF